MAKKLQQYTIRYVNGFSIRNTADDEFGIIHRHSTNLSFFSPKFYIPKNEIWIDAPYKHETDFLLAVEFFLENERLPGTTDYAIERKLKKEKLCAPGTPPLFIRRSKNYKSHTIDYVDGSIVRKFFDPEFILGGHDLVYDYIPSRHIWIDAGINEKEVPYILKHELLERELMKDGVSYDIAHEYATSEEKKLRRHDGIVSYPGDSNYVWSGLTNDEIIKRITLDI